MDCHGEGGVDLVCGGGHCVGDGSAVGSMCGR